MKEKYLNRERVLLVTAILLLAVSVIVGWGYYNNRQDLTYIQQIRMRDGKLYFVDRGNGNNIRIIRSDMNGEQGEVVLCERHTDSRYRTIKKLFFDDAGEAYVLIAETDIDLLEEVSNVVYYCDFDRHSLVKTSYDLTEVAAESSVLSIQDIRDGKLCYFAVPYKEKAQGAVLYLMDDAGNIRKAASLAMQEPALKSEFYLSDHNRIIWMDFKGEIRVWDVDSEEYLDVDGITGIHGRFRTLSYDGGDRAFVFDHQESCIRYIDLLELKSGVVCTQEEIQAQEEEFSFANLVNPECTSTGFCAGVESEEEGSLSSICIYHDGEHYDVEEVSMTPGTALFVVRELLLWMGLFFVILGVYWYVRYRMKYQTILLRIILVVSLSLFAGNIALEKIVEQIINIQSVQNQFLALMILGQQMCDEVVLSIENDPDGLPMDGWTMISEGNNAQSVYDYTIISADDRDKLFICESTGEYSYVPVEWAYNEENSDVIYEAYRDRSYTIQMDESILGRRNNLYLPIVLNDGTVFGVLAVAVSGNVMDYELWYYQWTLSQMTLMITAGVAIVLILILRFFLKPLKNLKVQAGRLAEGEMGLKVPVRGYDEIAGISRAFNHMSEGIASYVNDIQEMSDGYYKFIPAKILELLGKESIQQVKLGDQILADMTILSIHTIDHSRQRRRLAPGEVYEDINQVLSVLVDSIVENHGVVNHFEDSGLSSFFAGSSEEAVNAAVEMQRALEKAPQIRKGISIAVSYGPVMIGVIGHEDRLETAVISAHCDLAKELRLKGEKYGAGVLVTHLVCRQIPEFEERYHARYLGNIYISANDTLERIYDVYDGDTEEEFYYKELTKEQFERGVELFVARKFYEARLVFVEVLKQHRKDRAAKEYLYLCDRYYKLADAQEADTVIERF